MKLTLEQFETQWAENNLSVTDWFDTTYGLFKELETLQSTHEAQLKQAYIDGSNSTNELIQSLYKQIEQLKDNQ